jgi:hypothetical protein
MTAFTDEEATALTRTMNRYEPSDIHAALDDMRELVETGGGSRRATVASGPLDFGSVAPGVLIFRTDAQTVRMRLTLAEMTGGLYDEIELAPDAFRRFAAALLEALAKRNAPHTR